MPGVDQRPGGVGVECGTGLCLESVVIVAVVVVVVVVIVVVVFIILQDLLTFMQGRYRAVNTV